MTFTRAHVGYSDNGQPLYEYHLDGTPFEVVRTYPDRGRDGWTIIDNRYNDRRRHAGDAWRLQDAKALAERRAFTD